eukprot:snap_masked-scaffold_1-processed-gene-0.28-mRNA-1 protein AED:1.00 eAED:1.00 QI:0/0/0/0/1/1/3/0/71
MKICSNYLNIFNLDVFTKEKKKAEHVRDKFNLYLKRKSTHNTFYKKKTSKKGVEFRLSVWKKIFYFEKGLG